MKNWTPENTKANGVGTQPRAIGAVAVSVRADETGKTRLKDLRQSGSMKVVFPHSASPSMEGILVNTAGGITGGDRFDTVIEAEENAAITLTTQASERAYRAQSGEIARVTTTLNVGAKAHLNWLPQELILYENCALKRQLNIALDPTASLLMVEPLVFGRTAMQERLTDIAFQDRIKITRNHVPIYIDGIDLHGDAATHLSNPAIGGGANAMANLVFTAPGAGRHLDAVRTHLQMTAGASLIADDILVVRLLAPDSFALRRSLIPVLDLLTNNTLPTSWRL